MINILLTCIAYLFVATFAPIGILFQIFFKFKTLKKYFFSFAVSLDQLGNVICQGILNLVMIKKDINKFGNPDETISSVIGKNYIENNLTYAGSVLAFILNKLDTNHVVKAIEKDEANS